MIQKTDQLLNAVTMLPYVYLSYIALDNVQRVVFTLFWLCSILHHACLSICKENHSFVFFVFDCLFQIGSLLVIANLGLDGREKQYMVFYYTLLIAITCVFTFVKTSLQRRKLILGVLVVAHVSNAILGYFYAQDRHSYWLAIRTFILVAILFVADEFGHAYTWILGHVLLMVYTYFFWKSMGLIRS